MELCTLQINEGLLQRVVHSVNRHILFLQNRKPLLFSSKNRHRPTGRTIILMTDLLTARSKFFAICQLNNHISPHKDHKILRTEQIVSITPFSNQQTKRFPRLMGCSQTQRLLEMFHNELKKYKFLDNLVLSTELTKEIRKLTFRALALCRSKFKELWVVSSLYTERWSYAIGWCLVT